MGKILAARTDNRAGFVAEAFKRLWHSVPEGPVLIKPNIVSHEPYPTTTHPDTLDAVLSNLSGRELLVADASAADLMRPGKALRQHELAAVCNRHGLELIDLYDRPMSEQEAKSGVKLDLSDEPSRMSSMISLPVFKTHIQCMITGALKNHFGLLGRAQRGKLHFGRTDIHKAIASLHQLVRADLYIVDAVKTLTNANEVRHGGRETELGYMFAGRDPVALDSFGLGLLAEIDPKLKGKKPADIPHIHYAAEWGVGSIEHEVEWIEL
ncbi:MAG: DUF362 domain-containing protein [bacterium]